MSSSGKLDEASPSKPEASMYQINRPRIPSPQPPSQAPPTPLMYRLLSGTHWFTSQHLNAEEILESLHSETYEPIIRPMPTGDPQSSPGFGFGNAKVSKFAVQDGEDTKYSVELLLTAQQQPVVWLNPRSAPASEIDTGSIHWLKDPWRADSNDLNAEGNLYGTLRDNEVRIIIMMKLIATGNVYSRSESIQTTLIGWVRGDKEKLKMTFQQYTHHRLVLDEVGRNLTSSESTGELLGATTNEIEALIDEHFQSGVLHRDASTRNLVIDRHENGKLIDWDLCRTRRRKGVYTQGYTGTWQFISGRLLQEPHTKYHDLADDLESFLHVLTWTLVCYSESTLDEYELANFLDMYDEELLDWPNPKGGRLKAGELGSLGGYLPDDFDFKTRPGLTECILQIADLFFPLYLRKRYRKPEHEDQISRMTKSREENGGVDMINIIKATMEKARVLKETQPEKWPANDKAEKRKVAVKQAWFDCDEESVSYSKRSSSKRSRNHRSANCQSPHLAADPMHSLQELGAQDIDGEEEEDREEDRVQKKARVARK